MKLAYLVWALLPAGLVWLCIWAKLKDWTKTFGKEYVEDYIGPAILTIWTLALAILVDIFVFPSAVQTWNIGEDEAWVSAFLIYPVILLAICTLQGSGKKKDKSRVQHTGF